MRRKRLRVVEAFFIIWIIVGALLWTLSQTVDCVSPADEFDNKAAADGLIQVCH